MKNWIWEHTAGALGILVACLLTLCLGFYVLGQLTADCPKAKEITTVVEYSMPDRVVIDYLELKQSFETASSRATQYQVEKIELLVENQSLRVEIEQLEQEANQQSPVVYGEYDDWRSLVDFKAFIKEHRSELVIHLQSGRDGKASFSGACSGWAIGLRELGAKYGMNIEVVRMTGAEYRKWFGAGGSMQNDHYLNMVVVGQAETWLVEPQNMEMRLPTYIP